jgi:hypothetical protein
MGAVDQRHVCDFSRFVSNSHLKCPPNVQLDNIFETPGAQEQPQHTA